MSVVEAFFMSETQTDSWSRILSHRGSAHSCVSHNLHASIIEMEA